MLKKSSQIRKRYVLAINARKKYRPRLEKKKVLAKKLVLRVLCYLHKGVRDVINIQIVWFSIILLN